MKNIGIFYGSSTGNTEAAAQQIQQEFGDIASVMDVSGASSADLEQYDNIILGASTWGIGEMQDDFDTFLSEIDAANLAGKKIAIFGLGDQDTYIDSFVDAIGEIFERLQGKDCEVIGYVPTDGYEYDESRAEKDGSFVGLPLDEENQGNLSDDRIKSWVETLKKEFV